MKLLPLFLAVLPTLADTSVPYPGAAPGAPQVQRAEDGTPIGLKNDGVEWEADPQFTLVTDAGEFASDRFSCSVAQAGEAAAEQGPRAAAALPGLTISADFRSEDAGLNVHWQAELRQDAHYVREIYTLTAERAVQLRGFTPLLLHGEGFSIPGEVPGTPIVQESGHVFYAVELPMAAAEVHEGGASMGFDCALPLAAGQSVSFSVVSGVYPPGQLRRAFLAYIERERAVPYHPFLLYNDWYDLGLNPSEEKVLGVIGDFRRELAEKRGIVPDSFVLDDGWDDWHSDLWREHPQRFPHGFTPVSKVLREMGSHLGVWISPLGGYSGAEERVAHAVRLGLLPEGSTEMDLAQPAYYQWFAERCTRLMREQGVNFFKWDRAGSGVSPHFMALLRLADELRQVNPELFLSTTVGTWPSPFWLRYVDCTWRTGSADVYWMGEGSNRERAITYRDAACYRLIVQRAPLYPLNALMHHGLVLGREYQARYTSDMRLGMPVPTVNPAEEDGNAARTIDFPVDNDLRSDVRMLTASGANMQELYLTPEMMDSRAWDDVAEAIRWGRRRADVLADAHWVGGDPAEGAVYGYAAWRADRGAALALRNPSAAPRRIALSPALFEPTAEQDMRLRAAYADQRVQELHLRPGVPEDIELQPFEVLVFETDAAK